MSLKQEAVAVVVELLKWGKLFWSTRYSSSDIAELASFATLPDLFLFLPSFKFVISLFYGIKL